LYIKEFTLNLTKLSIYDD